MGEIKVAIRRIIVWIGHLFGLFKRMVKFYRQYGFKSTLKRIVHHREVEDAKARHAAEMQKEVEDQSAWDALSRWIDETPKDFIDIFPLPMGWSTPLFQRFQHISLNAGKCGGISIYGAHPSVDPDVKTYKIISPSLCLINMMDQSVADYFWRIMDQKSGLKIIRIQSIDLATTVDQIKKYIDKGYQIVYEYIDELTPQITGNLPNTVIKRHKYILKNEEITVVATSEKLFNQVKPCRSKNMLMLNNGVDYDHWHIEKSIDNCPEDLKEIVEKNKIILGYHGAIAQWIDYHLLNRLANDNRFILLIIGYNHDGSLEKSGLLNHENVYVLGAKSYFELPKYSAFYDVGILPFVLNDITRSVSPVKIFEYMAVDKPVVSYALPECKKYKSCLCADTEDEFVALVDKAIALRENEEYLQQLRSDAVSNTWVEITKKMLSFVKAEYKRKLETADKLINPKVGDNYKDWYISQVLTQNNTPDDAYAGFTSHPYKREEKDPKVIAYYLTQFHRDAHNELWWGKGVTEWNNVCRAVPQYVGHYQPRLPGELGFYDLSLKENMLRQIELAKAYGIYGFSFYYYWFNGERLLEKPLERFLNDKDFDFPFSLCWANENWTKRFDGTNYDILMEQPKSVESYKAVITDMVRFLNDPRYIVVDGKKLITVYRPSLMPQNKTVLAYWREYCRKNGVGELYIIAVKENQVEVNWLDEGFDAVSEFHPGTLYTKCKKNNSKMDFIRNDFSGEVFSYADIVENQRYFEYNYPKLYRAVMPMWDNTARRDNKGMIFDGAKPPLYKKWLKDVISEEKTRDDLDDQLIFVNAWNEWGEGAYLEPDKKYGYAFLEATKEAIEESREST